VSRRIKTKAPRAVPWDKQYPKCQPAENQFRSFFDQEVRRHGVCFEEKTKTLEEVRIGDKRQAVRVVCHLTAEYLLYLRSVIDMVDVPVCNQQKVEFYPKVANPLGRSGRRIKENGASRPQNEIGVCIEDPANKRLNLEHSE